MSAPAAKEISPTRTCRWCGQKQSLKIKHEHWSNASADRSVRAPVS